MKVEVLCKVVQHGDVKGVKGDKLVLPDDVAKALIADKKVKEAK
jgi:hypothetical protein